VKTPESWEKTEIRQRLDACGAWVFSPFMAGYGKSGVSDIVGCYRGKFFAIEVKREGKEPTPIQTRRMAEIEAAGGKTFWGTASRVIPLFEEWINAKSPQ
jgi:hypothetical protein